VKGNYGWWSEVKCSAVKGLNQGVPWNVIMVGEVKWSEVKCSAVKGLNQGVPWRVIMVGEVKWNVVQW